MAQVIEQGDLWGRVGKNIGEGLSEQLPKEVGNYRLSKALDKLEREGTATSPLQQWQSLRKSGLDQSEISQALPLLRQSNINAESAKRTQQSNQTAPAPAPQQQQMQPQGQQPAPQQQQMQPQAVKKPSSIVTPESTLAAQEVWKPTPYEQKLSEAQQLSQQNPATYPTAQDALSEVDIKETQRKSDFDARQAGFTNQTALETQATKAFNEHLSEQLQKNMEKSFRDVWGPLQSDIKAKMFQDIVDGVPVSIAAKKYGEEALEIAKTMQKLRDKSGFLQFFQGDAKTNKRLFDSTFRDTFKKIDRLEDFQNILQSTQGLTPAYAANFAYPLEGNKKNYDYIKELPYGANKTLMAISEPGYLYNPKRGKELRNITDKLMENFNANDSPLTYALALSQKGYDPRKFLDRVRSKWGKKLNQKQSHDMEQANTINNKSLGDAWLYTWTGKKPIEGI
jgi:hypothetical protein